MNLTVISCTSSPSSQIYGTMTEAGRVVPCDRVSLLNTSMNVLTAHTDMEAVAIALKSLRSVDFNVFTDAHYATLWSLYGVVNNNAHAMHALMNLSRDILRYNGAKCLPNIKQNTIDAILAVINNYAAHVDDRILASNVLEEIIKKSPIENNPKASAIIGSMVSRAVTVPLQASLIRCLAYCPDTVSSSDAKALGEISANHDSFVYMTEELASVALSNLSRAGHALRSLSAMMYILGDNDLKFLDAVFDTFTFVLSHLDDHNRKATASTACEDGKLVYHMCALFGSKKLAKDMEASASLSSTLRLLTKGNKTVQQQFGSPANVNVMLEFVKKCGAEQSIKTLIPVISAMNDLQDQGLDAFLSGGGPSILVGIVIKNMPKSSDKKSEVIDDFCDGAAAILSLLALVAARRPDSKRQWLNSEFSKMFKEFPITLDTTHTSTLSGCHTALFELMRASAELDTLVLQSSGAFGRVLDILSKEALLNNLEQEGIEALVVCMQLYTSVAHKDDVENMFKGQVMTNAQRACKTNESARGLFKWFTTLHAVAPKQFDDYANKSGTVELVLKYMNQNGCLEESCQLLGELCLNYRTAQTLITKYQLLDKAKALLGEESGELTMAVVPLVTALATHAPIKVSVLSWDKRIWDHLDSLTVTVANDNKMFTTLMKLFAALA